MARQSQEGKEVKKTQNGSSIEVSSIIPIATATGMLILGSHKKSGPGESCFFPLPEYLIWTGSISIALVVIGVVGDYSTAWVNKRRYDNSQIRNLKRCLSFINIALYIAELILLIYGVILVYPNLPQWQYKRKDEEFFCEYGMVMFSVVFLTLALSFHILGAACIAYLIMERRKEQRLIGNQSNS